MWLFGEVSDETKQKCHWELAEYFSGFWAGRSKPYSDDLKTCVQRFFPAEQAADRNVPHQPRLLEGDLFDPSSKCKFNVRRMHELVRHLVGCRDVDRALLELTSPEYIGAKFALRNGAELMREYAEAEAAFEGSQDVEATSDLRKCRATVGRFLKDLEEQPGLLALQMCFQQADLHPLCVATKQIIASDAKQQPCVIEWSNKHNTLDPCQLEIRAHSGSINAVSCVPGKGLLATASDDRSVKILDMLSGQETLELLHAASIQVLAVSEDGQRLMSGGEDGVKVWNTKTGTQVGAALSESTRDAPTCLAVFGATLVAGSLSGLRIYNAETMHLIRAVERCSPAVGVAFCHGALFSAHCDGTFCSYNIETFSEQEHLSFKVTANNDIKAVAFCSYQDLFATSCDHVIHVWSAQGSTTFSLQGHTSCVNALAFSEGSKIVSGSGDYSNRDFSVR